MPKDSTPRSFAFLILNGLPSSPGGSNAPTVANGILMPGRALGAPQTTWQISSPLPATLQTRSLSASGCCSASKISPTTTPLNSPATGSTASTSRPAMVICSTRSSVVRFGLTHSRNQLSLIFINLTVPKFWPFFQTALSFYCSSSQVLRNSKEFGSNGPHWERPIVCAFRPSKIDQKKSKTVSKT